MKVKKICFFYVEYFSRENHFHFNLRKDKDKKKSFEDFYKYIFFNICFEGSIGK